MGQMIRRLNELDSEVTEQGIGRSNSLAKKCPDLANLPPELGLSVLSHLNATDLCLAACVWDTLANDEILWQRMCQSGWGSVTVYKQVCHNPNFSFKRLYMILDEATLTFNGDPFLGEEYLINHGLVADNPLELAKFIHSTKHLKPGKKREYLNKRRDVLEHVVRLQNFQNQFLPNALRRFFVEISAPTERGDYLTDMMEQFSQRFCTCNPKAGLDKDTVFVLCFSLIMLSVDLTSPHVKNKMSKREFIRNTRRAAQGINDELAGHLYDNIYLIGHVAAGVL